MRTLILSILYLCSGFLFPQSTTVGARSAGMGNASCTLDDLWAAFNNQAGLAHIRNPQLGSFYDNRYLLPELSFFGLAFAIPVKKVGVFGANISRFGYSNLSENKLGLSYSRSFAEKFSLGIQFNLHYFQFGDIYGFLVTATGELGFRVKVSKSISLAGHIANPTRTSLAEYDEEKIPTVFKLGISWLALEKMLLAAELEKDLDHAPEFRLGGEYAISEKFKFRIGLVTNPPGPSFGCGVIFKKFSFDLSSVWRPRMGFSPSCSINYTLRRK